MELGDIYLEHIAYAQSLPQRDDFLLMGQLTMLCHINNPNVVFQARAISCTLVTTTTKGRVNYHWHQVQPKQMLAK